MSSPESLSPSREEAAAAQAPPLGFAPVYQGILKGASVYSVAVIAPRLASLILLRVYTRYLTPSDYGIMELLDLTVSVFGLLLGSNLASAFLYFYFQPGNQGERKAALSSALLGAFLLGAVAACGGILASAPISQLVFRTPQYALYFHIVFASFGFALPAEIGYAYLRAENRPWLYVSISLATLAAAITSNVLLLVVARWGIRAILMSTLITTAGSALGMGIWIFWRAGIVFRPRLFYRMVRYSIPVGLGSGSMFLLHFSDRFILMRYVSTTELGIYSVAYKFGMLISFIQSTYNSYWTSQMYKILKGEAGAIIYGRVFTYVVTFLTYAAVLLAAASGPALQIMTTPAFRRAAPLIPWLAAAYVIRAAGDHFRCVYYVQGRPDLDAKVLWSAGLTCLAASFLLIPRFGIWGAVASTIIGFVAMAVIGFFTSRRRFVFQLEWRRLLLAVSVGAVLCVLPHQVAGYHFLVRAAAAGVVTVLYPLTLWVAGFFSEGERRGILGAIAGLNEFLKGAPKKS